MVRWSQLYVKIACHLCQSITFLPGWSLKKNTEEDSGSENLCYQEEARKVQVVHKMLRIINQSEEDTLKELMKRKNWKEFTW